MWLPLPSLNVIQMGTPPPSLASASDTTDEACERCVDPPEVSAWRDPAPLSIGVRMRRDDPAVLDLTCMCAASQGGASASERAQEKERRDRQGEERDGAKRAREPPGERGRASPHSPRFRRAWGRAGRG